MLGRDTETAVLEEGVYNNNLEKRLEPLLIKFVNFVYHFIL